MALAVAVAMAGCAAADARRSQVPAKKTRDASGPSKVVVHGLDLGERFHVEVGDAPSRGPSDAPVTVVMFTDFQCGYCQVAHDTLLELEKDYPDKVRYVYKAFPLAMHQEALLLALIARSAQTQRKFWAFHDELFRGESNSIIQLAERAGLDVPTVLRETEALTHAAGVQSDLRQGRRLGVESTPTLFINGRALRGAPDYEEITPIIDEELAVADKLKRKGVPPADVYAHTIRNGYKEVRYSEDSGEPDPDHVVRVPIDGSPTLGSATAPVTIVMFSDFECPFCARGHETISELREIYGNKLRLVFKHHPLPFHSHAHLASRAAVAAGEQSKFWAFHDAIYRKQAQFDEADLHEIAKAIDLDVKAFKRALGSNALDRQIEHDMQLAASLGVRGTPAYFINGRAVLGAQPVLNFRLVIEEELERAERALERGVAPEKLYETLCTEPLE